MNFAKALILNVLALSACSPPTAMFDQTGTDQFRFAHLR